ncbi:MAG TPA: alpha/beta hydrolase [Devosia sp.]|uniref:alpha/beta fold hydrolase n=1 Tax=Devosia sp. TaxID=1871048 RepID=UPI002F9574A0
MPITLSSDGTPIGYESRGTGPAIIFIAGATQYRLVDQTSGTMADDLADRFTVIQYDRRGRGESGNASPYTVQREVEDLEALIEVAGGRAGLFGMSSGALLALEAGASLRDKVSAIVLYEPPVDPQQSSEACWAQCDQMATLAASGRGEEMMVNFMSGVGMPAEALAAFRQSPQWPAYAAVGPTLAHDFRIMAEATDGNRQPSRWMDITMPVLVVNGDNSFPFIDAGAAWVAAGLPNASRQVLSGQDHRFDPHVLAPILAKFFAQTN